MQAGGPQPGVLLERARDDSLVGIQPARADLRPGMAAASAIDGAPDGVVMDAEGVGDGADRPVLGVEEAPDLGPLQQRDHRAPSAPRRRAGPEQGQPGVTDPAAGAATAGTAQRHGPSRIHGIGIDGFLLPGRRRDRQGGGRSHDAAGHQRVGSLMRHVLAGRPPAAVAGLPGGVLPAPAPAVLVAAPRGAHGGVPRPMGARPRAVAIPAITAAAQEEHLPAVCAVADDEPERVHAPPRAGRGGGQSSPDMGRQGRAESRAPAGFGPRARRGQDSGPSPTSALGRTALPQVSLDRKRRQPAPLVAYPESRSFW